MSHKDRQPSETGLPRTVEQNPAPVESDSQQYLDSVQETIGLLMTEYMEDLTASNYVSQVTGSNYTIQYQALIRSIALLTIQAEETALDGNYKFTRTEFLYQIFGMLVFPEFDRGIPVIPGDVSYRDFLQKMVDLLLGPATAENNRQGIQIMTDALVTITEKVLAGPDSGWDMTHQFEFEVDVEGKGTWTVTDIETGEKTIVEVDFGTGFPENPFLLESTVRVLQRNADLVLTALKPAHTIYSYRHLFRDVTNELSDSMSWEACYYYYEDFRKYCEGFKELTGDSGETLVDRTLFTDVTLDFKSIRVGSQLEILSGPNASPVNGGEDNFRKGLYIVVEILQVPVGTDSTERPYTTSPTGLEGFLTVSNDGDIEDSEQDFSSVVEGEVLTIQSGPNAGNYRMDTFLGNDGGSIGHFVPTTPITKVRLAPSLLRVRNRMPKSTIGQSYRIGLDHLGVRTPLGIQNEDVTSLFLL